MKRKPEIRDIVYFYFLMQDFIDGNETVGGVQNDRFGACFLSYDSITEKMRIDRKRIKLLADILETSGIIRVVDKWQGTQRFKWYFPSFCPRITNDGYLVNEDGEIITPDFTKYKPSRKASNDA
jgi:hypothetical protein